MAGQRPGMVARTGRFAWLWILPLAMLVLAIVIVVHDLRETLKPGVDGFKAIADKVRDQSMFDVANEVYAQIAPHLRGPNLPFPLGILLAAVEMAPQLPGALFHVLAARLAEGGLAFMVGLTFVAGYITVLVFAFRQQLYVGLVSIVMGPLLVAAVFWVLQQAVAHMADGLAALFTCCVACGGAPGMCWLCLAHGALNIRHAAKAVGHGVEL